MHLQIMFLTALRSSGVNQVYCVDSVLGGTNQPITSLGFLLLYLGEPLSLQVETVSLQTLLFQRELDSVSLLVWIKTF